MLQPRMLKEAGAAGAINWLDLIPVCLSPCWPKASCMDAFVWGSYCKHYSWKTRFFQASVQLFQQFVKSCGSMLGSEKCLHRVCQVGILATALAIFVDKSSIIMLKGLAANSDHLKPSRGLLPSWPSANVDQNLEDLQVSTTSSDTLSRLQRTYLAVAWHVSARICVLGCQIVVHVSHIPTRFIGTCEGKRRFKAAVVCWGIEAYLCAMMADWLQGPFVYALYDKYGSSTWSNDRSFLEQVQQCWHSCIAE